ncbi:squalene/phytoene synthase family protein [Candidatus Liberibacter africanus]|nr:squalene/phytoene synthase family protein [Candidatus Liberibacter africanus]
MDYNHYLACLLSPSTFRISIAFLYHFNADLMRIRDVARNPIMGDIRLQWWKDIFESSHHDIPPKSASPFAVELLSIIHQYHLPYQCFLDMIEAHLFDSYNDSIFDCKNFEIYAFKTSSHLIRLVAMMLDNEKYSSSLRFIKHAGIAQLIGQLISQLPIHCHRRQLYIPLDILGAVGLDRESFLYAQDSERISRVIRIFAELGLENLYKAREGLSYISSNIFPAFIPVGITEGILKNAQSNGFKIFSNSHKISQFMHQWRMLYSSIRKHF